MRLSALRATGFALAAMEKAVQRHYERALRPPEARDQPWIDRVVSQLRAGLAALDAKLPQASWIADEFGLSDISAACAFGFIEGAIADLAEADRYRNVAGFCARAEALPAFKAAAAKDGATAQTVVA